MKMNFLNEKICYLPYKNSNYIFKGYLLVKNFIVYYKKKIIII